MNPFPLIVRSKDLLPNIPGWEAAEILEGKPAGAFLVRLCQKHRFGVALSSVSKNGQVVHEVAQRTPDGKWAFLVNRFRTLESWLQFHVRDFGLRVEFKGGRLGKGSCYHGDLPIAEVKKRLEGELKRTFLFRYSSKYQSYVVSLIDAKGELKHVKIGDVGEWHFNKEDYQTLFDLWRKNRSLLKRPLIDTSARPDYVEPDDPLENLAGAFKERRCLIFEGLKLNEATWKGTYEASSVELIRFKRCSFEDEPALGALKSHFLNLKTLAVHSCRFESMEGTLPKKAIKTVAGDGMLIELHGCVTGPENTRISASPAEIKTFTETYQNAKLSVL